MCTTQKPTKRFDYDAYIQGRMIGKYVVIFHDIMPEVPEETVPEVAEVEPVAQELIVTKPDNDIPEICELNVYNVNHFSSNKSFHKTETAFTGMTSHNGLAMSANGYLSASKPFISRSRAGPHCARSLI